MTEARTMTLADFLLERIDEDERHAASGVSFESWNRSWDSEPRRDIAVNRERVGMVSTDYDEHICRHDPARVLAECEAKRRIIELHAIGGDLAFHYFVRDGKRYYGDIVPSCRVCVHQHADMDCENEEWPCPTLRLLALPYADHADYRAEWSPAS